MVSQSQLLLQSISVAATYKNIMKHRVTVCSKGELNIPCCVKEKLLTPIISSPISSTVKPGFFNQQYNLDQQIMTIYYSQSDSIMSLLNWHISFSLFGAS